MKQTHINELKDRIGQAVRLRGWLYNKRSSGKRRSCNCATIPDILLQ